LAKAPEELLAERTKRLEDAYALRQPDRVPISLNLGYMLAKMGGITFQELDADPEKAQELLERAAVYFQPDQAVGLSIFVSAPSVMLGDRLSKWPGYGLPPDKPMQFLEGEYMKAEEYDEFLDDPTNFSLRTLLPRMYEKLGGLKLLPRIPILLTGYPAFASLALLNEPDGTASLEAIANVLRFHRERIPLARKHAQRMEALGFPTGVGRGGVFAVAPFDFIGDTLRGMRGVFLDMRRYPEKLLAMEEKVRRICVDAAVESARATRNRYVFIPLHRGSDSFMSIEQFEVFYWPQFKQLVMDLIAAGLVPSVFYEGVWDKRLQYLRELPAGKTTGRFQSTNVEKLKETIGDVMCICGCFPSALLQLGTREQVRELTKKFCEVLGKGGGFVMGANSSMDECDPELVKEWCDATREYGAC
jgi:uroporphyrinogen-III decarboxylase